MEKDEIFLDYYSILQVHPECDARTLDLSYRNLAKIYHPDHPESADPEKFNAIIEAYRVLRKAEDRLKYDVRYALNTGFTFSGAREQKNEDFAALTDANIHAKLLLYLYKRRRERSNDPGVGVYDILRNLNCPEENFDFHIWYLKKKGFIETTEDGTLAITVVGVDHVIAMSQTKAARMLRITQAEDSDPQAWPEREVSANMG
jgi:curved DNA-binding protein